MPDRTAPSSSCTNRAQPSSKYPTTVVLRGNQLPEKYRDAFRVDLRRVRAHMEYVRAESTAANTTNGAVTVNLPLPDFLELPAECRVWHRVCAKRAGLKEWFPWTVDRDVSCHGCGRKLPRRTAHNKEALRSNG